MSNINSLIKLASRTAAISFLTLFIVFCTSLLSSKAHAAHISVFPKNAAQIKFQLHKAKHLSLQAQQKSFSNHKAYKNRLTLKAIQHALKKVADGSAYKWHHKTSNLRGHVKPTTTYLNAQGQLCRHIQFSLYAGTVKKKSRALACRNQNGLWIVKS